jgi:Hint domain
VLGETAEPITWIGRREMECAHHPKPRPVWPVRIAAGAFGPGRPHSGLFLSPNHAVCVNEVLIPIRLLVNGSTIVQVPQDQVTYYHIELPRHELVLAQGLPVESFLHMKDGSNYASHPGPVRLYPDLSARMWEAFGCAPLIVTGPELVAARALIGRFAEARKAA